MVVFKLKVPIGTSRDLGQVARVGRKAYAQGTTLFWHMILRKAATRQDILTAACLLLLFTAHTNASLGDRLPEFKSCVAVRESSGD